MFFLKKIITIFINGQFVAIKLFIREQVTEQDYYE
jgi:hypothetical protein